jgi:hypothetical protein
MMYTQQQLVDIVQNIHDQDPIFGEFVKLQLLNSLRWIMLLYSSIRQVCVRGSPLSLLGYFLGKWEGSWIGYLGVDEALVVCVESSVAVASSTPCV